MADRSVTFRITGMTCGHCAKTIGSAAQEVPGVSSPAVDLAQGTLTLVLAESAKADEVVAAIQGAGYGARSEG